MAIRSVQSSIVTCFTGFDTTVATHHVRLTSGTWLINVAATVGATDLLTTPSVFNATYRTRRTLGLARLTTFTGANNAIATDATQAHRSTGAHVPKAQLTTLRSTNSGR
jgi:hypothetical protein